MSDNHSIQFIQNGLTKVLGTSARSSMSGYVDDYIQATPQIRRHLAVTTALELIKADIQCNEKKGSQYLQEHMENLGLYADSIQQALEVK
ncbi:hypothetical protein [Vibrio aestuarianus]|uniref:Uncharacterized protein n=1 Tax=Vibrio aestuarianus TaxID=28171 RepID=A0ABM9FTX4_9VIBR|nr:hypothetical protein [Vibrio aestuarianus]MDE1215072.1 hypothetical protein [Vibrio aestuarianus]MDE1217848.1 hypothetical protein [Vibrio aestuarianus]MDE1226379.1 hypothetical protein [Vibrio aestuarianus]MDE1257585.1 hypothetical protein [Vibrio aestuarianus]MDE1262176.1 hypothetical protein [Vibrio aestuarianus]